MSDSVTLLPPNATELEKALARCAARVSGMGVTAKMLALWNPATCPAATLPWLAQALHVDEWSETWTEAQKRAVIAASVATHKRKGTIGALKRALAALGYEVVVDEDTGIPFTFRLAFNLNQTGPLTGDTYAAARRVALSNKNARSHLLAVRSTLTGEADLHIGVAHYRAQTVTADAGVYVFELQDWDGVQDDDLETVTVERDNGLTCDLAYPVTSVTDGYIADPQTEAIACDLTFDVYAIGPTIIADAQTEAMTCNLTFSVEVTSE